MFYTWPFVFRSIVRSLPIVNKIIGQVAQLLLKSSCLITYLLSARLACGHTE